MDCTFIGNQIKLIRACWGIPDLLPCDVHGVFDKLGVHPMTRNGMYSKDIIFFYTRGRGGDYAAEIAKKVYSLRKKMEKEQQAPQPEKQQYVPRRKGESNASLECLRNMDESKNIFITESQLERIQESLGDMMFDPRKVNIVTKYLDKGFKRGNMACIGNDGYPCDIKIVAMMGSDGSVLKNMTHEQLFYLLQDRFNKIFSEAGKRDNFLRAVIDGWHNKTISKDGIIKVTKVR